MCITLRGCQPPAKRNGLTVTLTFAAMKKKKNKKSDMHKIVLICLAGMMIPFLAFCQQMNVSDSLLNNQVNATKKLYREIRKFNEVSEELVSHLSEDINHKKNLSESITKKIADLNSRIQLINKEIAKVTIKEEDDSFKIWDFISGALAEIIGAFIGVTAAFLLFFKETRRDKKKEEEIEKIDIEEKNHYFGSLLSSVIRLANNQNQGIIKHSEEINKNPTYIPLITLYPYQDLKRLGTLIDNEEYYHAFLNKHGVELENVKKYRRISRGIDYLRSQFKQMYEMQEKAQKFDLDRKYKYKDIVEKMMGDTLEVGKLFERQVPELMEFIANTFQAYYQGLEDHSDLDYIQSTFVQPVKERIVASYMNIPEARYVAQQLKNATFIYSEIRMQNSQHSESFKEISENLKSVLEHLEKDGEKLIEPFKKEENTAANNV